MTTPEEEPGTSAVDGTATDNPVAGNPTNVNQADEAHDETLRPTLPPLPPRPTPVYDIPLVEDDWTPPASADARKHTAPDLSALPANPYPTGAPGALPADGVAHFPAGSAPQDTEDAATSGRRRFRRARSKQDAGLKALPDKPVAPESLANFLNPGTPFADTFAQGSDSVSPGAGSVANPLVMESSSPSLAADAPESALIGNTDGKVEKVSRFKSRTAAPKANKAPAAPTAGIPRLAAAAREVHVVLPASNFDLLEGVYKKVLRTRMALLVTVGVVAASVVGVLMLGLSASNEASALKTTVSGMEHANTIEAQKLGAATSFQGISGTILRTHAAARTAAAKAAAVHQLDVAQLVGQIGTLTGGTVTSIIIGTPPAVTVPGPNGTTSTTPTTIAVAGAAGSSSVNPNAPLVDPVTITAQTDSFSSANAFIAEVKQLPGLTDVRASFAGSPPSISVTFSAKTTNLALKLPFFSANPGS